MSRYTELKDMSAPCVDCFFAFSQSQFEEGVKDIREKNKDAKIVRVSSLNLFGTKEGVDNFLNFYKNQEDIIRNECEPQEVYDYEFDNHECGYLWDDTEAIKIVVSYFGVERAREVKRRCSCVDIDSVNINDLFA